MSYEGRIQSLCKKGHYLEQTAPYMGPGDPCPCGSETIWSNGVDDTNGDAVGYIPINQFQITPDEMHTCSCGHTHVKTKATFRVPSKEEERLASTMWIWRDEQHVHVYEHDGSLVEAT